MKASEYMDRKLSEDFDVSIDILAIRINEGNKERGFWSDDNPKPTPECIALMHSELSEALEAHRKGLMDSHLQHREGIQVELADTIIRILDYCGYHNIDIGTIMREKLAYNETRPYKHGKNY